MGKRITIGDDVAITCRVAIESDIKRIREMGDCPEEHTRAWLASLEAAYDRLTVALFGAEFLRREKERVREHA